MRPRKVPFGRKDDCLTRCLSRLLDINYEEVPFYARDSKSDNWISKLTMWSSKRGYHMDVVFDVEKCNTSNKKIIGVGKSPRDPKNYHAVIVDENLHVVFDPSYNKKRSIRNIEYIIVFEGK